MRKSRPLLACLVGLVLFAQLPQALNVCISLGGGVQVGYGCQCADCLSTPETAPTLALAETGCTCDEPQCLTAPVGAARATEWRSVACCDDFKLPYQAAAARLRIPQPECCTPLLAQFPAWQMHPRLELCTRQHALAQAGQPPGRDPCHLLGPTILLI